MIKEATEPLAKAKSKVTPVDESEIKMGDSPEDKILNDDKGGFKNIAHYFAELIEEGKSHQAPENLRAWDNAVRKADMEEGSLSAGGYLVPQQFSANILEKVLEGAIVKPRAAMQPMMSNRVVIPADVDANHQTNYFGGITIYRPGEAGQKSATSPTYARIELVLNKVTGLCHISDELLEDSAIAVEANVTRKFSQAIMFVQDDDFLNGNGANKPLGCLNSANPCLVTVTAITGQGSTTIIWENIRDMWSRCSNKSNAVWVANHDTFPQLAGMSIPVGTGGVPVWMPAGGASGSPYNTLMGRPIIFTEKCQTLGTAGDIALCDFSQYVIGEKGGLQVATSMHFKFDYDQQSFRFVLRYDGQPTWNSALTPIYSSSTLSPFVVLNSSRS
jgi:HK97 family phage major capsid protein